MLLMDFFYMCASQFTSSVTVKKTGLLSAVRLQVDHSMYGLTVRNRQLFPHLALKVTWHTNTTVTTTIFSFKSTCLVTWSWNHTGSYKRTSHLDSGVNHDALSSHNFWHQNAAKWSLSALPGAPLLNWIWCFESTLAIVNVCMTWGKPSLTHPKRRFLAFEQRYGG